MMRKFLLLVLLAALVITPMLAQDDEGPVRTGIRPDAPPYAIRGPHPVGFMTFNDGDAERPINGVIWYPAIQPEGIEEAIIYDGDVGDINPSLNEMAGRAILDAEPATSAGPYPLVVSSHGMGASPTGTAYLHEHLASHGFVVMAPYHPGNTWRDRLLVASEEMWIEFLEGTIDSMATRPLDISQTINYAEVLAAPEGELADLIDLDRVSVIGFSYGGYTALAAAGGRLDFGTVSDVCASDTFMGPIPNFTCMLHGDDLLALEMRLQQLVGIEAEPGQLWPSFADERVDVIVGLAAGGANAFISEEGFAEIVVPTLLLQGSGDTAAVPEHNALRAWEYSGSPIKAKVMLQHADHLVFAQCPTGMFCADPVWDIDRARDLVNHFATAFLLAELYGDEDARAALAPDAVSFPGIGYEAVGY